MTPTDDRERLSAWLDGECSPEETREVLARLESDPALLREAEELRRVWDLLGRYPDEPVPEGFADAVLARVRGERAVPAPRPPWRVLGGGAGPLRFAAAAAVVASLGLGAVLAARALAPAPERAPSVAVLDALPAEAVENLTGLSSLTDAEFEALLSGDPDELARLLDEAQGG
jgi:anti-sigma factor RsiW